MTSPIQGTARVRVVADTSSVVPDVLAAFQAAVQAAEEAVANSGLTLDLDVDPLLDAVAQAEGAVDGLDDQATEITLSGDATPVVEEAERAEGALSGLEAAAAGVGTALSAGLTIGAGAAATLTAAVVSAGAGFNILSQGVSQGLTAVLGTRDAARELIAEVIELNQTAAFSRQSFLSATQILVGFGVEAEQVTGVLDAMQQAVVAVGGGEEDFARLTETLARVASQGRVTGETLQQLGQMGINLPQIIADTTGQAVTQVEQAIEAGQVGLEEITQALAGRFSGAVEGYADTWAGALGLVQAGLRNIGSLLVEPFIDLETGGLGVQALNSLATVLFAIQSRAEPLARLLEVRLTPTFDRLEDRAEALAATIGQLDFVALFETISDGLPAFAGLAGGISAVGSAAVLGAIPGLSGLAGAINPVVAAITAAALASPELRDVLLELLAALAPLAPALAETATILATGLSSGLATAATLIEPAVELVAELVQAFTSLPGPVQTGTLAVVGFLAALRFGPVGVAVAAVTALSLALDALGLGMESNRANVVGLAEDIQRLGRTGRVTAELDSLFGSGASGVEEFADKLDVATASFFDWSNNLNRTFNEINAADQAFADLDAALAQTVDGGADANEVFASLVDTYRLNEQQVQQLLGLLPEYNAAAERQAEISREAGDRQEDLARSTEDATAAMRAQADELLAQVDPIFALNQALQDVSEAQTAFTDAVAASGPQSQEARDASFQLTEAALRLQGAVGDAAGTFSGRLDPALRDTLGALGLNANQLAIVEDAFRITAQAGDDFAQDYVATAQLRGDEEARRRARLLQAQLDNITRTVTISFRTEGFAPVGGIAIPNALGGIYTRPVLSTLAEDHRPEVVIPLTRPQRALELAQESGLLDVLARALETAGSGQAGARPSMSLAEPAAALAVMLRSATQPAAGLASAPTLTQLPASADRQLVDRLAGPAAPAVAGLGRATGSGGDPRGGADAGGDADLLAELQALRRQLHEVVQAFRAEVRNARPVNVTQAPGEDGEALAKRVVNRMTLAGVA